MWGQRKKDLAIQQELVKPKEKNLVSLERVCVEKKKKENLIKT